MAICDLRLLERAKCLAFPPFRPPEPAKLNGSRILLAGCVCSTIEAAIWFRPPLRGLFGLPPNCLKLVSIASCPLFAASCNLRRRLSDCSSRSIATFQVFLSAFFTPRLCLSGEVLRTFQISNCTTPSAVLLKRKARALVVRPPALLQERHCRPTARAPSSGFC